MSEGKITHYGLFRKNVPESPMIKEADFFIEQGGKKHTWGKGWEPIYDCKTIGDARRKLAAKYAVGLSDIYAGEE